ncbi:MAG: histidine kinase [Bacteroidales bacterium]
MNKFDFLTGDIKLDFLEKHSPTKLLLISLVVAAFIIYPNIAFVGHEFSYLGKDKYTAIILFFTFRYLFFTILILLLLRHNLSRILASDLKKRLIHNFLITAVAYFIYIGFSILLSPKPEWISGILLFQFFIVCILSALNGHVAQLYSEQRRKEQEIEQLKIENLQSRFTALTNQINPHFFFNSLNGLTSLIRKKNDENTLAYVNKLSDVFRYILQSEKKGLVPLEEELEFMNSFRYMMEVRFATKLVFNISVDKGMMDLKIPVLSLLPLIDNVVMHNTIDSEHKMEVNIWLNDKIELVVSNPIFPKLAPADTNGTGLKNLENRFSLLMNKHIRIENDGKIFCVYMPLK